MERVESMARSREGADWRRWAVTSLLILGLLSCLILLIKLIPELQLQLNFSVLVISLLFFFYLTAVGLSALLWQNLVRKCTGLRVPWRETLVGIAALMLGKYVPGKVAGLTGRMLTIIDRIGLAPASFVTSLEQIYLLSGLVIFAVIASVAFPDANAQSWMFFASFMALVVAVGPRIFILSLEFFGKKTRFTSIFRAVLDELDPLTSFGFMSLGVIIAALICTPAWFLPDILSLEVPPDARALLVAAYAIAIVGGMMTLILPGGIGAREGAFVLLTQSMLTLEVSIAAAALLRIINVVADLMIGFVGFLAWKTRYAR
jgi:uncharacterized membrane protein YbhN (UPF0104 family)